MAKMWAGRTSGETNEVADDFNASISVDKRMYRQDITGSMAHAAMLAKQGILTEEEKNQILLSTRHYAKRQMTWFRHQMQVNWYEVNLEAFNETISAVINDVENWLK